MNEGNTPQDEIVPDSEDERLRALRLAGHINTMDYDIIEISSDEDEVTTVARSNLPALPNVLDKRSVFQESPLETPLDTPSFQGQRLRTPSRRKGKLRYKRIIESSSSGEDDNDNLPHYRAQELEVIELSDSSIEVTIKPKCSPRRKVNIAMAARDVDTESSSREDDGILILNEPRSASRPLRLTQNGLAVSKIPLTSSTPRQGGSGLISDKTTSLILDTMFSVTPANRRPSSHQSSVPLTPSSKKTKKPATPLGSSKKASEQTNRELYAQKLFEDLNKAVFDDGLPKNTKLTWSKRLLSTAGRAKWHRSKDGVNTTEIELAEKILDCNERIKNTLSHEMCHLASWIIDGDPKECHGKLWKKWVSRVTRKRPDIEISTRHDYEISYPFQWKCQKCAKIYGRFSKSIRPDEVVCGACQEGSLLPLFVTPRRDSKAQKTSRMAAVTPQDSPCSIPRPKVQTIGDHNIMLQDTGHLIHTVESDSDIEILTTAMRLSTISSTIIG